VKLIQRDVMHENVRLACVCIRICVFFFEQKRTAKYKNAKIGSKNDVAITQVALYGTSIVKFVA